MLPTALLLVAMVTSDGQSLERPALVREPSPSGPLAKRFATLFPVDGSSTMAPPGPAVGFLAA